MPSSRLKFGQCTITLVALTATVTLAQIPGRNASTDARNGYPNKPIRMVTAEAGGGVDFAARLVAQGLTAALGQQAIVDNRGLSAIDIVARARPDGYTLLTYGPPTWLLPFLRERVTYDPVKDFAPVASAINTPNLLVVHSAVAVNSVKDLIALAKARPGEFNYASTVTGGSIHLAAELFKSMAGIDIVRISYKGAAAAVTDLVAGRVQLMFPNVPTVAPHIKAGRLKGLAVTSALPSALAPGLPTVAASGLPGYESVSPFGVFAPAGTPVAIIDHLNQEIVRALHQPDAKERVLNMGGEVVASSPAQFAAIIKAEMAKWGKLIKDAGIRDE